MLQLDILDLFYLFTITATVQLFKNTPSSLIKKSHEFVIQFLRSKTEQN